ncbi:MAG: mandelate racemase/muconate lactonizing enzyme family protein [Proteobacteria bacterium]|nr:mandelate racemase/muconate lactonizing enzyme family protein [Pseudomonadota bacterium]
MTAHGCEIAAIECFHVEWPGPKQFPARSSWVRVRDKAGRTGLGEASPMLDSALSLSFLSGYVAPDLIGADPFDTAVIYQRALNKAMKLGPHGIVTAGLAALDIALWDLKGKIVGRPIYALLGGAWRKELPFYASIGGLGKVSVDDMQRTIDKRMQDGPALIKIRMEHGRGERDRDVDGDIAKLRAARRHLGPSMRLAFDASNGYSVGTAIRIGRILEDEGYTWFEEPVEHYHLEALEAVSRKLDIPVSAGEQSYTLQDVAALIDAGVSIVQPDIIKMGGFTGMLECKALALAHGVDLVPHQTQPAIGHAANLHFVAAQFQSVQPCELNDQTDRQSAVFAKFPRIEKGLIKLGADPGLGLVLDEAKLAPLVRPI